MANGGIYYWRPLLPQLDRLGVELDQRMQHAWDSCASMFVTELQLLTALLKLNARGLECLPERWLQMGETLRATDRVTTLNAFPCMDICHPRRAEIAARFDFPIWMRATELAGNSRTITCQHFCRAISDTFLDPWQGEPANTPPLIRFLGQYYNEGSEHERSAQFDDIPKMLSDMPQSRKVIEALAQAPPGPDDFQYALCLQEGRIVFRAVSVLGDFAVGDAGPVTIAGRGLLTHFKSQFGGFTPDEITELEEMIRNPNAKERDFQAFLEKHPHFFRRWDYREVRPQVYLVREGHGPLVPDFILTNPEIQQAMIVELKLPKPKLVRRRPNRDRFASAIEDARAQLLEYRDWFREKSNRQRLAAGLRMEAYEPRLAVIIGRSADFQSGIERQKLVARTPDVEVVTYDDLLAYARDRMVKIGG